MTTLSPSSRILRNPWGVARTKLEARGEGERRKEWAWNNWRQSHYATTYYYSNSVMSIIINIHAVELKMFAFGTFFSLGLLPLCGGVLESQDTPLGGGGPLVFL